MCIAGVGLVGATLAARILGPRLYGSYFLGLTIVSVVAIASDLCVSQAILTRSPGYTEMWRRWRALSVLLATAAALLTFAVAVTMSADADSVGMWLVLTAGVPISLLSMTGRAFLILDGKLRYIASLDVTSVVLANVLMLLLVAAYQTLTAAAVGQLIIAIIRWIGFEFRFRKPVSSPLSVKGKGICGSFRSLWSSTSGIYQSQLSGFIARNGDNLIVSAVLGPFHLAQYSRAYSFLLGPLQQAQMALTPMTLRDLTHSGLRNVPMVDGMRSAKHLLVIMLPLTGTMAVAGEKVVSLLLGPGWESAGELMAASAGLAISMTVALPARWILIARRNSGKLKLDSLLQYSLLVGVLVGSVVWGLPGSLVLNATLLGPAAAVAEWMLLSRTYRAEFLKTVLPWTAALTILPALAMVMTDFIGLDGTAYVAMAVVIAVSTSAAGLLVQRKA
ncbi:oligosaccharide flippase family protein [Paenarthrobacter sp. NEAU-H11]|uniref:oligosaccharide flippase family protein n=1 Tax=Paenarthrobacter sp. NEAU-H11 TaxID=3423924 RepID=UPI003D32B59A